MQANIGIVGRHILRQSERLDRLPAKIDSLDCCPVFRPEISYYLPNACAGLLLQLRLTGFFPIGGKLLNHSQAYRRSPVVIDNRIPQDPVEPRYGTLRITQLSPMFESLEIGRLQNVLGCLWVAEPLAQKPEKPAVHLGKAGRSFLICPLRQFHRVTWDARTMRARQAPEMWPCQARSSRRLYPDLWSRSCMEGKGKSAGIGSHLHSYRHRQDTGIPGW